jgi:hypothetical protein
MQKNIYNEYSKQPESVNGTPTNVSTISERDVGQPPIPAADTGHRRSDEDGDQSANAPNAANAESDEASSWSVLSGINSVRAEDAYQLLKKQGGNLFSDRGGTSYLTVPNGQGELTFDIRSKEFTEWVQRTCFETYRSVPGREALERLADLAHNKATFTGPEKEVYTSTARCGNAIYIDLRRPDGKVVRIDRSGWEIKPKAPIPFLYSGMAHALPIPKPGGSLTDILEVANIQQQDLPLVCAFLLGLLHGEGTQPVLFLRGSSGSGKTMAAEIMSSIIDPHAVKRQGVPKSEEDLLIAAKTSKVLVLDNLSGKARTWLSDAICRIASGGGQRTRKYYTNTDESIISAKCAFIITSIDDIVGREDFAQRAFKIEMEPVDGYRSEVELRSVFEAKHPAILGALCNAAVAAIRNLDEVRADTSWDRPRLVDVAEWIVAAESALPYEQGGFLQVMRDRQRNMVADLLEGNRVFEEMHLLVEEMVAGEEKILAAAELSAEMAEASGAREPMNPAHVSADLNRHARVYEKELNIEILKNDSLREKKRRRKLIRITKLSDNPNNAAAE